MPQTAASESPFVRREAESRAQRVAVLDAVADQRDRWREKNAFYYRSIENLVRFLVPPGASVLEIGCSTGDLLAALRPAVGVGIDIAPRMIEIARGKYPGLSFFVGDAETLAVPELNGRRFDYIIMSDVVGELSDVWSAFRALHQVSHLHTHIFISWPNFLWEPVLRAAEQVGLKMPVPQQNWLGLSDLENLLALNHFEVIRAGTALLLPKSVPVLSRLANRYLAQLPGFRHLCLTQFFVARPAQVSAALPQMNREAQDAAVIAAAGPPLGEPPRREYSCSVIVPCRNERGNIDDIVRRMPQIGSSLEILFVDGNSTDGTVEAIEAHLAAQQRQPEAGRHLRLIHQGQGTGKGDAVRKGFAAARGDVLFILDADLTVPPEDLGKFYLALAEGRGEFVNGSRLVYPMEGGAMRFLNLLGNKFFSSALSFILEQRLKDTLCGTKVLLRRDYERIAAGREFFGDFDPFGDFDLLFGAAKSSLRIVEMPVRYRSRNYGETKISRFRHGWLLVRMTAYAWRKFKLAY